MSNTQIRLDEQRDYAKTPIDEFYKQFDDFISNMRNFVKNFEVFKKYYPELAAPLEVYMAPYREIAAMENVFKKPDPMDIDAATAEIIKAINDPNSKYSKLIVLTKEIGANLTAFNTSFGSAQKEANSSSYTEQKQSAMDLAEKNNDAAALRLFHSDFLKAFQSPLMMPIQNMMKYRLSIEDMNKSLAKNDLSAFIRGAKEAENPFNVNTNRLKTDNVDQLKQNIASIKDKLLKDTASVDSYVKTAIKQKDVLSLISISSVNLKAINAEVAKEMTNALTTNDRNDQLKSIALITNVLEMLKQRLESKINPLDKSSKMMELRGELKAIEVIMQNMKRFSATSYTADSQTMMKDVRHVLSAATLNTNKRSETGRLISALDVGIKVSLEADIKAKASVTSKLRSRA